MDLYEKLLQARKENRACAIATVVQTGGSTARSAGAKMLVYGNGESVGSVGGGSVELRVAADCLAAIQNGEPVLQTYEITGTGDHGIGTVTVFIEPDRQRPCLYLCGCGHVAQAVLPLAKTLGYYVVCVDARDISSFRDCLKAADELHILERFADLTNMDFVPGASVIVCSYSHKTDGEILEAVLRKKPGYVGMLGGKPKIRALFAHLQELGYSQSQLRELHAPIGLDLGGETPAEVALSIMAQVQACRYQRTGQHKDVQIRASIFPD